MAAEPGTTPTEITLPLARAASWTPIVAFFLAAGAMFLADRLAEPRLNYVGLVFVGLAGVSSGLRVILTRSASFVPTGSGALRRRAESYSGCAAQMWGVFFVLFGVLALVAGAIGGFLPRSPTALVNQLLETPVGWGLLAGTLGLFLALYGMVRVLAGAASGGTGAVDPLRDAGYRGFGAVILFMGLALLAVALALLTAPHVVIGIVSNWIADLAPR